jgi:hypothetical protein
MSFDLISFFSGKASSLITNLTKTEVFPIRCDDIDITYILSDFPTKVGGFLGNYLGLPLPIQAPKEGAPAVPHRQNWQEAP